MKAASPALITLLASGAFARFDLYSLTLAGSAETLRYVAGDFNVRDGARTWSSETVRVDVEGSRTLARWGVGLDADEWQVAFVPRPTDLLTGAATPDLIGDMNWLHAVAAGALDGAQLLVERAYFANSSLLHPIARAGLTPVGLITLFAGEVSDVEVTDLGALVSAHDARALLDIQMPRNLYQAQCRHTLYGAGCDLVRTAYTVAGSAIGGTTRAEIFHGALATPGGSGTFTRGRVRMTSGRNTGHVRTIREWASGASLRLLSPFPHSILAGDTFDAWPGCNHNTTHCEAFGNLLQFGGHPFIPEPEEAL